MSLDADSKTIWKLRVRAFDPYHFHRIWTSPAKDMSESSWNVEFRVLVQNVHFQWKYHRFSLGFCKCWAIFTCEFNSLITFAGDVQIRWKWYGLKALTLSFRLVFESASEDITSEKYDRIELASWVISRGIGTNANRLSSTNCVDFHYSFVWIRHLHATQNVKHRTWQERYRSVTWKCPRSVGQSLNLDT